MPMATRLKRLPSYTGAMLLLLFGSLAPAGGSAQEAVVPLQFSFSDPGARSMGFGGAFVALADDATAAFSNPAGLTQLLRPEISIEIRHWGYSSPFTEHGRVENLPSGFGIDTTVGLQTATSENDHTGLSFLSFVFPMENWSLAFFRHEYANFEFFSETQGLFYGGTDCCQDRYWDQRSQTNLDILSYGLSAAYGISDRFDLGLGVVYYDASFFSDVEMFLWDEDTIPSVFAPNSYLPERSAFSERIYFDDADWAFTAGFLWRLSESFNVGGVYRQAPEIDVAVTLTAGQTVDFGVPPGEVFRQESGMLELPTLYGLGIAYQSVDGSLTVSFQWDHVEYSNIVDSLEIDDRAIDDVNELHLGAEYVFLGSTPIIAIRFGAWRDPDHQMRATSDVPLAHALLPRGEDEMHYAAGLGVATQRFQIDLAVDFADRVDTVSISAIYNF
jgi:long-subunit fatty acid transport protein